MGVVLVTCGAAAFFLALAFHFHWYSDGARWTGWAATGCMTAAILLFGIGGHLGGSPPVRASTPPATPAAADRPPLGSATSSNGGT